MPLVQVKPELHFAPAQQGCPDVPHADIDAQRAELQVSEVLHLLPGQQFSPTPPQGGALHIAPEQVSPEAQLDPQHASPT